MSDLTVANTILAQLGGAGRLTSMIGAHSFVGDEKSLTFKYRARAEDGSNCCRCTVHKWAASPGHIACQLFARHVIFSR